MYIRTTTGKNNTKRILRVMKTIRGAVPMTGEGRVSVIGYRPTRLGKLRAHWAFWKRRPDAVVVIDDVCEFPLLLGKTTLHVSSDDVSMTTVEPGGIGAVASFGAAWLKALVRTVVRGVTIRRDTRSDVVRSA